MWKQPWLLAATVPVAYLLVLLLAPAWLHPPPHDDGSHNPNDLLPKQPAGQSQNLSSDAEEVRNFQPFGSAASLFVLYGAYRGGRNTFAIVGLGSKPLYSYGDPQFECFWDGSSSSSHSTPDQMIKAEKAYRMLPDVNYGRVYTVVVVNCTFLEDVGTKQRGGQLVLYASYGDGLSRAPERIIALTEDAQSYEPAKFHPPYPYEFVYCSSPLYGNLSADRIREWIVYHVRLFGPKSHFIFHDAGGMHPKVRAVLEPWKRLGYITIQDVKHQAQYDGYYYNQFLINNDCLHRTKFMANWTFFFDLDEYIYVMQDLSLQYLMSVQFANLTILELNQYRMSDSVCLMQQNMTSLDSRWGFEKLVYRDMQQDYVKGAPKYAVQGRGVFATGVHGSQKELGHIDGEGGWAWFVHMRYYHYHNTISKHEELCAEYKSNMTDSFIVNSIPFKLDTSMVAMGDLVRQFENKHIGDSSA